MLFWAPGAWDSLVKGKCRCILREMLPRCLPMKHDGLEAFHGRLQDGCWLGGVYLLLVGILYGVKYYKYWPDYSYVQHRGGSETLLWSRHPCGGGSDWSEACQCEGSDLKLIISAAVSRTGGGLSTKWEIRHGQYAVGIDSNASYSTLCQMEGLFETQRVCSRKPEVKSTTFFCKLLE